MIPSLLGISPAHWAALLAGLKWTVFLSAVGFLAASKTNAGRTAWGIVTAALAGGSVLLAAKFPHLIDLRTLSPFDWDAIAASVKKTNRALIAYEDSLSWGYGAEIAARIADDLFEHLDAPVRRVAALDTFVAYQPILEDAILPQAEDLFQAMKSLAQF